MIWNEAKECMSRDELTSLQSARLVKLVDYVYHNVEFYRKKMQALGMLPGDIKSIEDVVKLPFTTKDDLRDNYPFGLFAVPQSEICRVHASSGTTGKATVVGYTRRDIDVWAECVARCFSMAGLSRHDIIQIAYGYGLFTGGLGAHYGAEKIYRSKKQCICRGYRRTSGVLLQLQSEGSRVQKEKLPGRVRTYRKGFIGL